MTKFLHSMIRVTDADATLAFFKLIGVEDGRLYATASTTCMVFAPNP